MGCKIWTRKIEGNTDYYERCLVVDGKGEGYVYLSSYKESQDPDMKGWPAEKTLAGKCAPSEADGWTVTEEL
jgi:hypothetical protein